MTQPPNTPGPIPVPLPAGESPDAVEPEPASDEEAQEQSRASRSILDPANDEALNRFRPDRS